MMNDLENKKVRELIKKAQQGDTYSQNVLVEKNIGLVWSIVKRFKSRNIEIEDIFQIGCIGLIKAIQKFDSSYDVRFSTYAVPMILGEIKRFLRDDGSIKVSRSLKELNIKAKAAKERMSKELGRIPTINELAEDLKVEPEELVHAIEAGYKPESLHSIVGESDNSPVYLIDRINHGTENSEDDIIDKLDLKYVLSALEEREREIIYLRYFKEETQQRIAEKLGISQVQVSRLEKRILKQLREMIE